MKYRFNLEFQQEIVKFILNNPDGKKAMPLVSPDYFNNLDHHIIIEGCFNFFSKQDLVPSKIFLIEELKKLFHSKSFKEAFTLEDSKKLIGSLDSYFTGPVPNGDILLDEIAKFAAFVELNNTIETTDLTDFDLYEPFSKRIKDAIDIPLKLHEHKQGEYLIKDIRNRQLNRQIVEAVLPTPFYQLNRWTNAGGYVPGSILVLLDKPKHLKTMMLVNIARGYLSRKRRVLFIDLENGVGELFMRLEQSIIKTDKKTLLSGEVDKQVQKVLRRYKRMGGEIYIERLPAFSTSDDIQKVIDDQYQEHGIVFDDLIIDYIAKMGAKSHSKWDDFKRISDAFVDVENLALKNNFGHIWTAMHVQREAWKRSETKFSENDVAKSIDIIRHVQGVYGLQRNEEERKANILRLEVVAQRDGPPIAQSYFEVSPQLQHARELTRKEVEEIEKINRTIMADNYGTEEEEGLDRRGDV